MSFERANNLLRESPRKARELALEILARGSDPRAWLGFAIIGSSLRAEGRFREAEAAFYLAATRRPAGPAAEFEILGKLANVYRDQNQFSVAMNLFKRKVTLASSPLEAAKARLECAMVQADPAFSLRAPGQAYLQANLARSVFEAADETPYAEAALGLELLCASEDPGHPIDDLDDLLGEYLRRVRYPKDSHASAQVHWLVGLVHRRLGRHRKARLALEVAASGFERQSMPVFWAVAKLDQAALELTAGHNRRAAEICGLIFPVLSAYRQDRQAWAAIRALFEASSREALTHMHLAKARRALLAYSKVTRSGRSPE